MSPLQTVPVLSHTRLNYHITWLLSILLLNCFPCTPVGAASLADAMAFLNKVSSFVVAHTATTALAALGIPAAHEHMRRQA